MTKDKIIKLLVPLVAVVVVVESVILVSNLDKGVSNTQVVTEENVDKAEKVKEIVADFAFKTESEEMKIGKAYEVDLNLTASKDFNLDGMEVYIIYDPEKVSVSKLTEGKGFPKMINKSEDGLIGAIFLWGVGDSYSSKVNESDTVLSFSVTPKVAGETEFNLVTSNETGKSATMIVESSTSEKLVFSNGRLEIKGE